MREYENTIRFFGVNHANIWATDRGVREFLKYHTVEEVAVNGVEHSYL